MFCGGPRKTLEPKLGIELGTDGNWLKNFSGVPEVGDWD